VSGSRTLHSCRQREVGPFNSKSDPWRSKHYRLITDLAIDTIETVAHANERLSHGPDIRIDSHILEPCDRTGTSSRVEHATPQPQHATRRTL
jgi:hypothetical protein